MYTQRVLGKQKVFLYMYNTFYIKEVLRRENQGLKVYPVDNSSFFSMTGTYFCFVLSILSVLIYKKNA
jgi:hypothetical protein